MRYDIDPMMAEQNQYDAGWYDGIEFGLTMKDTNEGILPDDNEVVLIYMGGMFLEATFYPLWYQENGQWYCQRKFVTPEGRQFLPGFIRYWMPMPKFPEENRYSETN